MVNESLTTRLARERLAAIKKFIPVRNRVRQQLQMRQQQQDDFVVGSEQLFKPITSATIAATGVLKKIAAQTKQAPKQQDDQQLQEVQPIRKEQRNLDPEIIFKSNVIEQVQQYNIDEHFAKEINTSFNERKSYMNEGYEDAINDKKLILKKCI